MSEQEPWLGDVEAAMERRIAAAAARPDFLDVVARAHAIDPVVWPSEKVDEAGTLEVAGEVEPGSIAEEAEVEGWLDDVRAAVDRRVEARQHAPLAPLAAPRARRGVWWIAGAAVAAAAMLVLGIGQASRMVVDSEPTSQQSLHMSDPPESTGSMDVLEPEPPTRRESVVPEPAPEPELEVEPEVAAEPEPEVQPEPEPSDAKPRSSTARGDRWEALADEAQAHWRAGRHEQAQRLFSKIVAEAGRARAAEMAYADLFTLASQTNDVASARRWWKAYLQRFPRGRFADDARAGLCRGADRAERAECWQAYLDAFPKGSFRGEARTALGKGAP